MELKILTTTLESGMPVQAESTAAFQPDLETENQVVDVHPDIRYQAFQGFGGTFTEAACYCMHEAGEDVQRQILEAYFGPAGLKYTHARLHLDSADASLDNYSAMNDPNDPEMRTFSLSRDEKYILPVVKDALAVAGRPLTLMISPWSPPPFMKTNGEKNHGGKLMSEYRALWAKYICRFIKEYEARGVRFSLVSLQNEPKAVQIWDSCIYTAQEEREMLREFLAPEMRRQGLSDIGILVWDHNKERAVERAQEIMADEEMRELVRGVAFHWYSGDHFEAVSMLRELYPDKRLIMSECCVELSKFAPGDDLRSARMYAREIIGDLNGGADAFIHWSLVFDPEGGPNHVNNLCEAPVVCDWRSRKAVFKLPYYYIGHFSRFIRPGAVRVGFSRYTDNLDVTAFLNPDGERVVVLLNKTSEDVPVVLRERDQSCRLTVKGGAIATLRYQ